MTIPEICPKCEVCKEASHHWLAEPDPKQRWEYVCKHCPVKGDGCSECGADGCSACDSEGVLSVRIAEEAEICPRCGAEEDVWKERPKHNECVVWKCGSHRAHGHFSQGERCKQKLLADARPKDHANRQQQVWGITAKILQHAAELRELADELDGVGCYCVIAASYPPHDHRPTCPMRLAWVARNMAQGVRRSANSTTASGKDVRHLTPPF